MTAHRPGPSPGGPRRVRPTERELDALARAVRKAQQQREAPATERAVYRARRHPSAWRPSHFSPFAATVLGAAVVVAVLLAFTLSSPGRPSRRAAYGQNPSPTTGAPPSTSPPTSTTSPTTTTTLPPTTTSTLPSTTTTIPLPVALPALSSITPSSGTGGIVVVVHGRDFISRNGLIDAYVDGQLTRVDCPSQDTCDVTIPTLPRKGAVPLTITTSGGRSNTLYFHYA